MSQRNTHSPQYGVLTFSKVTIKARRVFGDDDSQKRLEKNRGRVLRRGKPGPKKVSKRQLFMLFAECAPE